MRLPTLLLLLHCTTAALAQPPGTNYDEALAGGTELPDILTTLSGRRITTTEDWEMVQQPWILAKFKSEVYGTLPGRPRGLRWQLLHTQENALGGKAICQQYAIFISPDTGIAPLTMLLFTPKATHKGQRFPVMAGLNFRGNHTITQEAYVQPGVRWLAAHGAAATDSVRGTLAHRWPLAYIVGQGFAVATLWSGDAEPDHPEGWQQGIRGQLAESLGVAPVEWGAMGAWAWGLSRMADVLYNHPLIQRNRIGIIGHSRLGKAALWAAANDDRFTLIVSNNSGEGGAALSKRNFGETIEHLNTRFPHWFAPSYHAYNGKADSLPIDHHMLLASLAPRPLYVASATEDRWADPRGEFLSALYAGQAYGLYAKPGLDTLHMPLPGQSIGKTIGYHLREGKHDITLEDWMHYLRFARREWERE